MQRPSRLPDDIKRRFGKEVDMDAYKITGDMQMYQATRENSYLEQAASSLEALLEEKGSRGIPDTDLLGLVYLSEATDSLYYKDMIRTEAQLRKTSIFAKPLYTAYDTSCCGKAHYKEIAEAFRHESDWNGDKAVALADTIGQMSEEIFEHYKSLAELLKYVINQSAARTDTDSQELMKYGYAALKGYGLGALQHERYLESGMAIWKTTVEGMEHMEHGEHRGSGIEKKFRAQYLQLGK